MEVVLEVAVPVFALMLAGFMAGRRGILGEASSHALNQFVYWFALPAVLFIGMARNPVADILNPRFLGAFMGGTLAVYALGLLVGKLVHDGGPSEHAQQALAASFSNTGYMGIPLFIAAWGSDHLLPAIVGTVIMSMVMVGIAVVSQELVGSRGQGIGRALADVGKALVRNPLIISSLAGLAWTILHLPLPKPLANFADLLGASAGPCALFAIGLFLAGRPLSFAWREVGWIVALKLVVQPLLTWGLIVAFFPLDTFWTGAALLLAALPTGALTFVVAQNYGVYVERTSQVILLSTIVSLPSLSALLAVYAAR